MLPSPFALGGFGFFGAWLLFLSLRNRGLSWLASRALTGRVWRLCLAFTQQVNLSTSEELELPIPDSRLGQLQRDWDATYGLTLDAHLEPADSLRGRIWHEFSKRTLSVIEVNRVKSLLAQSSPSVSETVKLQDTSRGALSLSSARDPETPVRDVVSYYFGLRILINARSFCGNFVAKGPDGREARFFSLSEGLDYADSCLRDAMQYGQGSVSPVARWPPRSDAGLWLVRCSRRWSGGSGGPPTARLIR